MDDMNLETATNILQNKLPIIINVLSICGEIEVNEVTTFLDPFQKVYMFSFSVEEYCENSKTILIKKNSLSLQHTFETIHKFFLDDGSLRYSTITDNIYETDEEMNIDENIHIAKMFIIKYKPECSVCYNINQVFTKCGHSLCRFCFAKMVRQSIHLCPICRNIL